MNVIQVEPQTEDLRDFGIKSYWNNYLSSVTYLKNKSFTSFSNFNFGFFLALKFSNTKYETGLFYTKEFDKFIAEKLNDFRLSTNWESKVLQKCNNNEEKAFDLFFALLEEFKLEKEDLNS